MKLYIIALGSIMIDIVSGQAVDLLTTSGNGASESADMKYLRILEQQLRESMLELSHIENPDPSESKTMLQHNALYMDLKKKISEREDLFAFRHLPSDALPPTDREHLLERAHILKQALIDIETTEYGTRNDSFAHFYLDILYKEMLKKLGIKKLASSDDGERNFRLQATNDRAPLDESDKDDSQCKDLDNETAFTEPSKAQAVPLGDSGCDSGNAVDSVEDDLDSYQDDCDELN